MPLNLGSRPSIAPDWEEGLWQSLTRNQTMSADVAPPPAAPSAPTPATPSRNWLADIGTVLSSTAAGMKGDVGFIDRVRAQRTQQQQQAERMQIEKHGMALKVWEEIGKASKTVTDPKIANLMAESFSGILGTLGQKYSKEDIAKTIHDPALVKDILRRHKDLPRMGLNAKQIREYDENPVKRKQWDEQFDKVWGKELFDALLKGKDQMISIGGKEKKLSDVTFEELVKEHPDALRLTEEHLLRLNEAGFKLKSEKMLEEERKAKAAKPRALQLRTTDLGDKVLQETFDPETGKVTESKTLPKGRVPREAKEPAQAELIAEELSARREGKKPGSGHRPFRGLSDDELTNQLKKAMNPVDQAIAELMKPKEGVPAPSATQPPPPKEKKKGTYKVDGVYRYWDGEKWR